MNKKERINMIRELESELAYGRFIHTMDVACTAANLAMCYGEDPAKAELAGLLHDCAKCMSLGKMLKICEKAGVDPSRDIEKNSGSLLHSKAGAVLAARQIRRRRMKISSMRSDITRPEDRA